MPDPIVNDIDLFQERLKGSGTGRLVENLTGKVIHAPSFKFSLDLGIEEQVQEIMNPLGQMVTAGSFVTAQRTVMNLTFSHSKPEILELLFGRKFEVKASKSPFVKEFTVPADGHILAAPDATTLGKGMLANQIDSFASVVGTFGMSKPLTRVASGATAPAGPAEWSQGADFELWFSPDLARKTVSVTGSVPIASALVLGEVPIGSYAMIAMLTTSQNYVATLSAANCAVSVAGNAFDPAAADLAIKLRLDQALGECTTFQMQYLNQRVKC